MFKIRVYKKDLNYTYCLGVFPVMELLQKMPQHVDQVMLSSEGSRNGGVDEIINLCERNQIMHGINDHKIKLLAPKENTYAIAVFKKYAMQLDQDRAHVVLVEPRNMGNLGTIIRTLVAFGVYDLAIIRPAADVFDPKVISSTMGALFQVRVEYFNSMESYMGKYGNVEHKDGVKRKLYTYTIDEAKDIREVKFAGKGDFADQRVSLVFGNEGAGLSDEDAALGERVTIPQFGEVDSLNLSISVGVALWEAVRS
jgi:TrmH family RNA methyltransferase